MEVIGAERLPADGPVIVAANHHNALVDPMLLIAAARRPLVPLAKAPLFRHPLIAPFLRLVGAIPVHRRGDPGAEPASSVRLFQHAAAALAGGRALLIFPEGTSQARPMLLPLRTGASRMLLEAEAGHGGRLGVRLVPAGLVYHEPGRFRTGRALVAFGDAVETADCIALYDADGVQAVRRLTDRLAERLRALIVEADDRETLRLLAILEAMAREEASPADAAARAEWMRQAMRAYRWLHAESPARVEGFRHRVERHVKALAQAGLAPDRPIPTAATAATWRQVARDGAALVLGLPLAAAGMALHGPAYALTRLARALLPHEPDEQATYALAAGSVLYPLVWAVETWLAWRLGGLTAAALLLAALPLFGFFALGWRDRFESFERDTLSLLHAIRNPDLADNLRAQRLAIVDEMADLARSVPRDVLT